MVWFKKKKDKEQPKDDHNTLSMVDPLNPINPIGLTNPMSPLNPISPFNALNPNSFIWDNKNSHINAICRTTSSKP